MNKKEILARVDHTELNPAAKWADIQTLIDDAVTYGTATAAVSFRAVITAAATSDENDVVHTRKRRIFFRVERVFTC